MATFEEKAERLKKELEEAPNGDQRRNLSHEYELTLRLLRIIRGEVFTLDDINKCRMEIMRQYPGYAAAAHYKGRDLHTRTHIQPSGALRPQ